MTLTPQQIEWICYSLYWCTMWVMTRYNLDPEGIVLYLILVAFDMVFGITKSYVLFWDNNPHWFSFKKFGVGLLTKFVFVSTFALCIIVMSYASERWADFMSGFGISVLLVAQLLWVLHNAKQIQSKKALPEWDVITYIYDLAIRSLKKRLEKVATPQ